MKLLGFNFTKINAERFPQKSNQGIKVNTNIDVPEIKEAKSDIFKKESILAVKFKYSVNYEPEYAKIELEGNIAFGADPKTAKKILNDWKDKKISEEVRTIIFNIIFKKANLRALQLEEELALPFHIPMPSLKLGEEKKE